MLDNFCCYNRIHSPVVRCSRFSVLIWSQVIAQSAILLVPVVSRLFTQLLNEEIIHLHAIISPRFNGNLNRSKTCVARLKIESFELSEERHQRLIQLFAMLRNSLKAVSLMIHESLQMTLNHLTAQSICYDYVMARRLTHCCSASKLHQFGFQNHFRFRCTWAELHLRRCWLYIVIQL